MLPIIGAASQGPAWPALDIQYRSTAITIPAPTSPQCQQNTAQPQLTPDQTGLYRGTQTIGWMDSDSKLQ